MAPEKDTSVAPKPAAGILFVLPGDVVFLIRRAAGAHVGSWAFPGGWVDPGETREQAARRECLEEVGFDYQGPLTEWARRIDDACDFTTFVARIPEAFLAVLKPDEVDGSAWVERKAAFAMPLHPGDVTPLAKFDMDELGLAKAIRDRQLTSPQRYANVLLVALRITGTGVAYRPTDDEYAWREPALYLNDEFLARCNGLPVIWKHPPGNMLNSQEFADRIVGTVFLPYIEGEDVWAIAKIYDEEAAKLIETETLSTSPGVYLKTAAKLKMADGDHLLIEGKAAVLDHIAIVSLGVWDKGGPPTGVSNDTLNLTVGDSAMADDTGDKGKGDAAPTNSKEGAMLDKILSHLDAFGKRMDAQDMKLDAVCGKMDAWDKEKMDAAKKDEEEEEKKKSDAAKKDAEEEEKKKADAARKDAEDEKAKKDAAIRDQLAELSRRIPVELPEADRARLVAAQSKAERVAQALGDSAGAPRWLNGETELQYRIRLASKYQTHSKQFKDADLSKIGDAATFTVVEDAIYNDAYDAAIHPGAPEIGILRTIVKKDRTGREITSFVGDPGAAWAPFKTPTRNLVGLNPQGGRA